MKSVFSEAEPDRYLIELNRDRQPLSNEAPNFYEPRFGYVFRKVKVHRDTFATKSAQSINAPTYTCFQRELI